MDTMPVTPDTQPIGQLGDVVAPELYRSGRAKRAKARRNRLLSYAAGAIVVALAAWLGDWAKISRLYFDLDRAGGLFPDIITIAARNTLIYTVGAMVGGTVIGLTMAVLKSSPIRPYRWFATVYIEIFRGLPALLTIFIVGFALPTAFGVQFPTILGISTAGIIALALVAGAYLAETVRAGLEGVPKGQMEAARSLGMTPGQTTRHIVVPQAFRLVIPPLTNEFVLLLKDTSLLFALGTLPNQVELTKFGSDQFGIDFNGTPFVIAGIMYLIITIPLTQLVAVLERRFKRAR